MIRKGLGQRLSRNGEAHGQEHAKSNGNCASVEAYGGSRYGHPGLNQAMPYANIDNARFS